MKCLPSSKLSQSNGVAIHDWHAEILAIRTFNRFLLDECRSVLADANSNVLKLNTHPGPVLTENMPTRPFQIRDDVKLHMYCSEAPCRYSMLLRIDPSWPFVLIHVL